MTYIEFYGLPGTGKTTFSGLLNKKLNRNPRWKYSPVIICKAAFNYLRFLFLVVRMFFADFSFFKNAIKRPIHFAAFLKGMFVRFIVVFRHEKSGFFISDHGLIQTLSQNHVLRREMLKKRKFLLSVLNLFPKKAEYIYLKLDIPMSLKRILKREKRHRFSYEFLLECKKLFEYSKKHFKSPVISTSNQKIKVINQINAFLIKAGNKNE